MYVLYIFVTTETLYAQVRFICWTIARIASTLAIHFFCAVETL